MKELYRILFLAMLAQGILAFGMLINIGKPGYEVSKTTVISLMIGFLLSALFMRIVGGILMTPSNLMLTTLDFHNLKGQSFKFNHPEKGLSEWTDTVCNVSYQHIPIGDGRNFLEVKIQGTNANIYDIKEIVVVPKS